MKIEGQEFRPSPKGEVTIAGARATVQAVPLQFLEELDRILPSPEPKLVPAKDPETGFWAKDEGGRHIPIENTSDPKYQREKTEATQLRLVAILHEALSADPNVVWTAERKQFKDARAFYKAVYTELLETGIFGDELLAAVEVIRELGKGTTQEVDAAREGFSRGPRRA